MERQGRARVNYYQLWDSSLKHCGKSCNTCWAVAKSPDRISPSPIYDWNYDLDIVRSRWYFKGGGVDAHQHYLISNISADYVDANCWLIMATETAPSAILRLTRAPRDFNDPNFWLNRHDHASTYDSNLPVSTFNKVPISKRHQRHDLFANCVNECVGATWNRWPLSKWIPINIWT